ncbi:hypothetical protein L873DRAFT_1871685 [Choiromyces venosus 120613-1]|uniref:Tc1-like transposase DDE domain-containing protein n=1 Tax=Choiromyces venosus 120613-1 TaxID=1336337 RepID=A0A3N4IYZ2_9PEZI|nr:hypothetical protein L873DRAFT_1871685 [Choiromyces venosus 120613-1]
MVEEALKNYNTTYKYIAKKIAPEVFEKTIKHRLAENNLKRWMAKERLHIDETLAQKRLEWALAYRYWTKEIWRRRAIWTGEVTVERGERKVSQMMTGFFHGQRHSLFLPVFPNPSSAGSGVTGKSIIDVYDHYEFVRIWDYIKRELGEDEVFLIIDNTKTQLPIMRWLRKYGITLLEICFNSFDHNLIENIWSDIKDRFSKLFSELHLMKGPEDMVKKAIEEATTYYWELLDPKVFNTLRGSMVDRIKAIIKADGWYTKY